ncbi:MAG: hypothetical protein SGPRY_007024 [Prymnesium sp.]
MVNVGANKVSDEARFHAGASRVPSSSAWHASLLGGPRRVRYGCGLCNACRSPPPKSRRHVPVVVHAIEMVRVNFEALERLFKAFDVPGIAHHLAISNFSGVAEHARATSVGLEHIELDLVPGSRTRKQPVRVDTLEHFALEQGIKSIALLSIDAEGQDALVLEGAQRMLWARQIDILEFEFVERGFWRHAGEYSPKEWAGVAKSLQQKWLGARGVRKAFPSRACTQVSSPDGRPSCSIGELTMILFHASLGCSREPKYIKIFMIHVFEECHCFRVKRRRSSVCNDAKMSSEVLQAIIIVVQRNKVMVADRMEHASLDLSSHHDKNCTFGPSGLSPVAYLSLLCLVYLTKGKHAGALGDLRFEVRVNVWALRYFAWVEDGAASSRVAIKARDRMRLAREEEQRKRGRGGPHERLVWLASTPAARCAGLGVALPK